MMAKFVFYGVIAFIVCSFLILSGCQTETTKKALQDIKDGRDIEMIEMLNNQEG